MSESIRYNFVHRFDIRLWPTAIDIRVTNGAAAVICSIRQRIKCFNFIFIFIFLKLGFHLANNWQIDDWIALKRFMKNVARKKHEQRYAMKLMPESPEWRRINTIRSAYTSRNWNAKKRKQIESISKLSLCIVFSDILYRRSAHVWAMRRILEWRMKRKKTEKRASPHRVSICGPYRTNGVLILIVPTAHTIEPKAAKILNGIDRGMHCVAPRYTSSTRQTQSDDELSVCSLRELLVYLK